MVEIVGIRFNRNLKIYDFDANHVSLQKGDAVIVETENGISLGIVALPPREKDEHRIHRGLKRSYAPQRKKTARRRKKSDSRN